MRVNLGVALQLTNILRDITDDSPAAACICRSRISPLRLHRRGSGRGRRDRAGPPAAGVRVRSGRATSIGAPSWRGPPKIAAGWWRPRSCGRCTSRHCAGSSGAATTSSRRRPGAAADAGVHRAATMMACALTASDRASRATTSIVDRRRLRRAERGGPSGARRRARAGSRSAGAAGRAGDGVSPIARPASWSTTVSTSCSAATPRRSRSCATSARSITCGCSRS